MTSSAPVLFVTHVPWEQPHRIVDAFEDYGLPFEFCCPLAGDRLPDPAMVAAAVFMGGPMNVDDFDNHPALFDEQTWIGNALHQGVSVLGVCLGAQLIARAAGGKVVPGPAPEIGWSDVTVHEPNDPVLGPLAPSTPALHWHGDVFELPAEATRLASSAQTENQAFRIRDSWGLLFHAEADAALVDTWLAEPSMADEAKSALGDDYADQLRAGAAGAESLIERSTEAFANFAKFVLG